MSSTGPRITIRPPPHRDYLSGYPGIPASTVDGASSAVLDPIEPLPVVQRSHAHLSGTIELRANPKGPPLRARYLALELEKIETVPPPPSVSDGSTGKAGASKKDGRFVELIGTGPSKLWEVSGELSRIKSRGASPRKKGFMGAFKKGEEDEQDDGFEVIPDGNYSFDLPIPEGLPPTVEVDSKMNGISYQIVATLCVKTKKGLLNRPAKPVLLTASAPIHLIKADLLPWPAFKPVLLPPIPSNLPWTTAPSSFTIGERREAMREIVRNDQVAGEVRLHAIRKSAAYGPGDAVELYVEIYWDGEQAIKITRLDFVLRETVTLSYPSPTDPNRIIRSPPRVNTLINSDAPEVDRSFAVIYKDEPSHFNLVGTVPSSHSRVTVRTAKHIEVTYALKIRAMLEGGGEVAIDNWPVVVGNVDQRTARGVMSNIGHVEGLCNRPGIEAALNASSASIIQPSPPRSPSPVPTPAASHFQSHPSQQHDCTDTSSAHIPLPAPDPIHPTPLTTAEQEKQAYYERATQSRDRLQASLALSSPTATERTRDSGTAESFLSRAEEEKAALHHAAVLRRSAIQDDQYLNTDTPLVARGTLSPTRSNTTRAFSGSSNGASPPPPLPVLSPSSSSASAALLGRTLTTAESEKRTLFNEARQTAARRQEEARLELERSNAFLEALEFEEQQNAYEDRLIAEAEEERREIERRQLDEFAAQQAAWVREEEERWEREEEERCREALARLEERRVAAERAAADELRRFEEEQQRAMAEREADTARKLAQRQADANAKKAAAERLRRDDEERERAEQERQLAASRKQEIERQRDEAERRRQEGERLRLAEIARREDEVAEERRARIESQKRWELEQQLAAAEEAERRREEAQRRQEDEIARRRLEEERLAERSSNAAQHDAYHSVNSHHRPPVDSYNHQVPPIIRRVPSAGSFAPSVNAGLATADFYAQQLSQSRMSDEKAAYLARLRQATASPRQEQASVHPSHIHLPQPQPFVPSYPPALSPMAPAVEHLETVSTDRAPPAVPPLPPQSSSTVRTAAEEKQEAARRRAAADARGKDVATVSDEEDLPPSYPVPNTATAPTSAADEKVELQRYYAAKAAVEAQTRAPPPLPPSRSTAPAGFDHQPADTPAPVYHSAPSSFGPASPSHFTSSAPLNGSAPPTSHLLAESTSTSSGSIEAHRDPSVAAGKRPQNLSTTTSSFGPVGYQESSSDGYAPHPSAAPTLPPTSYYTPSSSPQASTPSQLPYASTNDGAFDEFSQLRDQIAASNAAENAQRMMADFRS